jgi:hypothetical protein
MSKVCKQKCEDLGKICNTITGRCNKHKTQKTKTQCKCVTKTGKRQCLNYALQFYLLLFTSILFFKI